MNNLIDFLFRDPSITVGGARPNAVFCLDVNWIEPSIIHVKYIREVFGHFDMTRSCGIMLEV